MKQQHNNGGKEMVEVVIPAPDKSIWRYSHKDLVDIYHTILAGINDKESIIRNTSEELENDDDGSNGFPDDSWSKASIRTSMANNILLVQAKKDLECLFKAKSQIEAGTYSSYCVNCKQPIELARIKFLLFTRCCIKCSR